MKATVILICFLAFRQFLQQVAFAFEDRAENGKWSWSAIVGALSIAILGGAAGYELSVLWWGS